MAKVITYPDGSRTVILPNVRLSQLQRIGRIYRSTRTGRNADVIFTLTHTDENDERVGIARVNYGPA